MPSKLQMMLGACCGDHGGDETQAVLGSSPPVDFRESENERLLRDVYPAGTGFLPSVATIESGYDGLVISPLLSDLGLQPIETLPTLGEAREAVWIGTKSS